MMPTVVFLVLLGALPSSAATSKLMRKEESRAEVGQARPGDARPETDKTDAVISAHSSAASQSSARSSRAEDVTDDQCVTAMGNIKDCTDCSSWGAGLNNDQQAALVSLNKAADCSAYRAKVDYPVVLARVGPGRASKLGVRKSMHSLVQRGNERRGCTDPCEPSQFTSCCTCMATFQLHCTQANNAERQDCYKARLCNSTQIKQTWKTLHDCTETNGCGDSFVAVQGARESGDSVNSMDEALVQKDDCV